MSRSPLTLALDRELDEAGGEFGPVLRRVAAWLLMRDRSDAFAALIDLASEVDRTACKLCHCEAVNGLELGDGSALCAQCYYLATGEAVGNPRNRRR